MGNSQLAIVVHVRFIWLLKLNFNILVPFTSVGIYLGVLYHFGFSKGSYGMEKV